MVFSVSGSVSREVPGGGGKARFSVALDSGLAWKAGLCVWRMAARPSARFEMLEKAPVIGMRSEV